MRCARRCEGVPEFVWIMPKIQADCYKQNIGSPCTSKYMCPHTCSSLQQQYHLPIPWHGDCSPGNTRRTRAARSCGVISLTPSLAVVHLQSSAPRSHPEAPASCHRAPLAAPRLVQGIPTTSWRGAFAGGRVGKGPAFYLSGPFNLYFYSNCSFSSPLCSSGRAGPGRAVGCCLPAAAAGNGGRSGPAPGRACRPYIRPLCKRLARSAPSRPPRERRSPRCRIPLRM